MGFLLQEVSYSELSDFVRDEPNETISELMWDFQVNISLKSMEKGFEDKLLGGRQPKPLHHLCGRRDENLALLVANL